MPIFNKETNEQITEQLVDKWGWMMESIEDKDQRTNTAILLENTFDKMVELGQITPDWLDKVLNEEDDELNEAPVTSSAVGTNLIPRVMFPMIRRVFPNLIANQLVSVQPITAPTGVIYYINYTYSDSKGEIKAGDEYTGNFLNHDNFTDNNGPGFARFYSANRLGVVVGTPKEAAVEKIGSIANLGEFFKWTSLADIKADITGIEAFVKGRGITLTFDIQYDDTNAEDTAPTTPTYDVTMVYNTTTGNSTFYFKAATAAPLSNLKASEVMIYALYNQEGSAKLPEMQFNIGSDTVNTVERKLKVRWTKESEQDMKAYHKIDVESELVKVASMEMNYEVDREVIQFIDNNVIPELKFQHNWQGDAAGNGTYDHNKNNTQGNYLDRHRALAQKIYQASSVVAQYNRIGACSWAVVSPQVGALLTMLPDFKGQISGGDMKVFEAGMLATGLKVYVDPNRGVAPAPTVASLAGEFTPAEDDILMGYKSTNMTYGAGVVYSPYTTWMSNTIFDPDNFNAIRGFFNRYALKLVPRGEYYYSKIYLQNYTL